MKTHFKVVAVNETSSWIPDIVARAGGAIFALYLFDSLRSVHCCEITPSYEAHLIESNAAVTPDDEGERELLDLDLMEGDASCETVHYFHCRYFDALPACHDFGENESDSYEEALEACLEYCRGNYVGPLSLVLPISSAHSSLMMQ